MTTHDGDEGRRYTQAERLIADRDGIPRFSDDGFPPPSYIKDDPPSYAQLEAYGPERLGPGHSPGWCELAKAHNLRNLAMEKRPIIRHRRTVNFIIYALFVALAVGCAAYAWWPRR